MYVKFLTNSWMLRLLPETYRMHAQSLLDTNLTISAPSQRSNLEMGLKKLLSRFNFCPIFRFSWWLCFWFLCASPLQCSDSAIENPEGNIGCGVSSIWNQTWPANWPTLLPYPCTLESGIDVRQGITVGPGKFVKKNKRRALNNRRAWTNCENLCYKKKIKLENVCRPWEKIQNLLNVGPLIRL
jgi:hypothetical protein